VRRSSASDRQRISGALAGQDVSCRFAMPKKKTPTTRKRAAAKSQIKGDPTRAVSSDFQSTFESLEKILQRHAGNLFVKKDEPRQYYLETISPSWKCQRMFFAAAVINKSYVSFHLMPLYTSPELLKNISSGLKRRMQGKSCFNFTAPDAHLFNELEKLTQAGYEKYKSSKFL
jgi:hypothetical protein